MESNSQCIFELLEGGRLPKRKTEGAAAYDLYCPKDVVIPKGRSIIPLGFKMSFPSYMQVLIEPRSNFEAFGFEGYWTGDEKMQNPYRFDADVLVGKIDSDYPDVVNVIVKSNENFPFVCKAGTRFAQMTFVRIDHPDFVLREVKQTTNRSGGLGSTGTH